MVRRERGRLFITRSFGLGFGCFQGPVIPERLAANDCLNRSRNPIVLFRQVLDDCVDQRLIGERHSTPQGVPQQLPRKLPQQVAASFGEQIRSQAGDPFEFGSVLQTHLRVDRLVDEVFRAESTDRVKGLKRESERVDANMALRAGFVADVLFRELTNREAFPVDRVRQFGDRGGGIGQFLSPTASRRSNSRATPDWSVSRPTVATAQQPFPAPLRASVYACRLRVANPPSGHHRCRNVWPAMHSETHDRHRRSPVPIDRGGTGLQKNEWPLGTYRRATRRNVGYWRSFFSSCVSKL